MKYTCTTHMHSYGRGHRPTLGDTRSGRWETYFGRVLYWTTVRRWRLPLVALFSYDNTSGPRVTSRSFLTIEDGQ